MFQDDPDIADRERLLRRIPPAWMHWDEFGNPSISSAAFKDVELSVYIETLLARAGREPADAVRQYPGYGLAALTAGHARAHGQAVAADPLLEEPAHGIVFGQKKRGGVAGKLRDGAVWVVTPRGGAGH